MSDRADIERIVANVLLDLRLKLEEGCFTDPNTRTISLYLGKRLLTSVDIDVKGRPEYEG